LLAFLQDTRGETEPGCIYYKEGNYEKAMESEVRIAGEDNRQLKLCYLLSAIELGRQDEALANIRVEKPDKMDLPDQSISWYAALAYLKSDDRESALEYIEPLTRLQGPYHLDAIRLEKLLLK
jgi:tetratricopeptide (TPR) repeat protein